MGKEKKAGIAYLLGNFILSGVSFLATVLFTRLMTPADYGTYSVYMSYESFLSVIIMFGVGGTLARAKIDYSESFDAYFTNIISIMSFIGCMTLFLLEVIRAFGFRMMNLNAILVLVLVVHSYCECVFSVYLTKLSTDYIYDKYLGISFANTCAGIVISILFILYITPKDTYYGRIYGTVIPLSVISLVVVTGALKKNHILYDSSKWKYAIKLSAPLMIHSISYIVLSVFDRIMISEMVGDSEAGIYSLMGSFANLLNLAWYSINQSWNQWVFDRLKKNENEIIKYYSRWYVIVATGIFFIVIMVIPDVITIMTDVRYHSGLSLLPALCAGSYFMMPYSLYVLIENYHKKTKYIATGSFCAGLVNILLNFIFIRKFGYQAAAYTTMITYFLLFIFHYFSVRWKIKNSVYDDKSIFLVTLSGFLIFYISTVLLPYRSARWIIVLILFVAILLCAKLKMFNISNK